MSLWKCYYYCIGEPEYMEPYPFKYKLVLKENMNFIDFLHLNDMIEVQIDNNLSKLITNDNDLIICRICQNVDLIATIFEINVAKLEKEFLETGKIRHRNLIIDILHNTYIFLYKNIDINQMIYDIKEQTELQNVCEQNFTEVYTLTQSQNIYLKDYQKANIKWMLNNETNKNILINSPELFRLTDKLSFNIKYMRFYNHSEQIFLKNKGGLLLDESGLGKTTCAIATSLLGNNQNNHSDIYHLTTNTTLIICPKYICNQWLNEILKGVSLVERENVNIKIMATPKDFSKIKYGDIINCDYLIVSYELLTSSIYLSEINTYNYPYSIPNAIETFNIEFINNKNLLNEVNVILTLIHWNRIIFDEINTYYNSKQKYELLGILQMLKSNYSWILSSNYFEFDHFFNYKLLLNFILDDTTDNINNLHNKKIFETINKKIIRRNTYQSTNSFKSLNVIDNKFNFTNEEKFLYKTYQYIKDYDLLTKICCYPKNNMINYDAIQQKWIQNKFVIDYLLNKTNNDNIKKHITNNLSKKIKCLSDNDCSICLSKINDNFCGITYCGHIFCYDCGIFSIKKTHKCPLCNLQTSLILCYDKPEKNVNKIQKEIGTKIYHLLKFLKEKSAGTSYILYTSYDDIAKSVYDFLKKNNINIKYFSKNIQPNSLDKLKKYDVLLMSKKRFAKGLNLNDKTELICLDTRSPENIYQLICQMNETVNQYNFLIENTIETI